MAETKPEAVDDKKRIAAVSKLFTELRQLQAREYEIVEEIQGILGGNVMVAELVKEAGRHFDAVWCERYAPGLHGRYVWNKVKDVPQLKRLLKMLTVDELKGRMTAYLANDEAFYIRARHSFGAFVASVNSHAPKPVAPVPESNAWTALLAIIEAQLPRHQFHEWFKNTFFLEETESLIRVGVQSDLHRDWIVKHYVQHVEHARYRLQQMKFVQFEVALDSRRP